MAVERLWRRLPARLRRAIWRALDRLGAWPVRLTAGPARGLVLLAPPSRWRGYRGGRHERQVLELLAERLAPGMELVDAGAFLGYFTLAAAARVGDSGRVWAFEPRARNRRRLARSVRRNGFANVTIVPLALGASAGSGKLTRTANPSLGRLVSMTSDGGPTTPVEVTTLDAWIADSGARPDVIKIDVEGGELDVVAGAAETLRRRRPLLVIELHRDPGRAAARRLIELLQAADYRVSPLGEEPAPGLARSLELFFDGSRPPGAVVRLHLLAVPAEAA